MQDEKDRDDIQGKGNSDEVVDHDLDAERYRIMSTFKPMRVKEPVRKTRRLYSAEQSQASVYSRII